MLVFNPDRLFLQKGKDQDLYVDFKLPLPQHQIDGIRFLYRQYKKKALGVILNDPPGYGKCMQVVLFLNALRPLLKRPVLVLTNSLDNWKEHFDLWTDFGDDIEITTTNPFLKKSVFISPVQDRLFFGRRNWGVVVVHDQDCTKELLQTRFDTNFKIWVTSVNLKENLHTLSLVYEWLHPKQKFNVDEFRADITCVIDVVEKAAMLDSCVEDFLLRRTGFATPFKGRLLKPPPVVATRKNKDPTGTKVKRSKRRRIEDEDLNQGVNINNTNTEVPAANKDKVSDEVTRNKEVLTSKKDENNINTEASTTKHDVVNTEATKYEAIDLSLQKSNESNKLNFNNEKPSASEVFKIDTENITFTENTNESITIKVNMDESTQNQAFGEAVKELIQNENKTMEEVITGENLTPGDVLEETESDVKNTIKILAPETEYSNVSQNILLFNKDTVTEENSPDVVIKAVTIPESQNTDSSSQLMKKEIVDSEDKLQEVNEINKKEEENKLEEKNCDTAESIINVKEYSNGDNTNCKEKTELVKIEKDNLDVKLAELEAKALSKFKGSFLDRIF